MDYVLCYCEKQDSFHIEPMWEHIEINIRRLRGQPIPNYHVVFTGTRDECKSAKQCIKESINEIKGIKNE